MSKIIDDETIENVCILAKLSLSDEAKEKADAEDKEKQIIADLKRREQQEELEARKAAKAARKANKKK